VDYIPQRDEVVYEENEMNYIHPLDKIDEENIEVPQPQVPLVERLMLVDPSVYDKSTDQNLILDMKLNRPKN